MITSKQRAWLRSMANGLDVILYVGKEGITEHTVKDASDALKAREIIKCTVQQEAPVTAKEALQELAERTGAEPVQAIGRRFVLYKRNEDAPQIELP